jgi:hypothetical protein
MGLEHFENCRSDPVVMTDCAGEAHEFHFGTRLLGSMVDVDAFELKRGEPAGYQFQILGDPDDDVLALLGRLVERMRRTLSVKHLVPSEHGLQIAARPCARESSGTKRRTGACLCPLSMGGNFRGRNSGECS